MSSKASDQRRIATWFDTTYASLGSRYLRGLQAYLVFPELLGAGPSDTLLDVACGAGMLLEAASEYTPNLYGCDISAVAVGQARVRAPRAHVLVANAEALPYGASTFDLVTCLASLERMLDRRRALAEMLRVGKPGARYCLMVRNSNTRSWKYWASAAAREPQRGHADADTIGNWTALFESAGFGVQRVLPDQYPLLRRQRWRSLFLRDIDFRQAVVSRAPLERANEFIFILEKRR
jgi:ubiquinone/menaquinone biosynthesis C-methylase UbiE